MGGHLLWQAADKWEIHTTFFKTPPVSCTGRWHQIDLTQANKATELLQIIKPDAVIHTAANSNLDACEKDTGLASAINLEATKTLANECAKRSIRFIFTSSDMVYDGEKGFYKETDPAVPISFYGKTKLDAENAIVQIGGDYAIVRVALIYGKPAGGGNSFSEWMEKMLRSRQTVPLFTDQYRTPILVNNLAEALLELAINDFIGIMNLGGTERIDRYSFGKKYCRIFNYDEDLLNPCSMHNVEQTAPRPKDISMNVELAQQVLKTDLLDIDDGLHNSRKSNLNLVNP